MAIRLVLAAPHPLLLDGLEQLFRLEDDVEVVGSLTSADEALRAIREHRPDVLVFDPRLTASGGLDFLRTLACEGLAIRTVLLVDSIEDEELLEAMRLGVGGVVLKEMVSRSVLECVRKVHAGELWIEKRAGSQALDTILRRAGGLREIAGHLTSREIEVALLICRGLRNREIAERLGISQHTVKAHLSRTYRKLQLDGRLALLRYAEDRSLI
jgi:DNA-binding NarL/FixJ family response regulator